MSDKKVISRLDSITGLWIAVAIGFAKMIEHTITDILPMFFTVHMGGVDLTVWSLYTVLWMATLSLILMLRTARIKGGEK